MKEITESDYEFYAYLRCVLDMEGDDIYALYLHDYDKLEEMKKEWEANNES